MVYEQVPIFGLVERVEFESGVPVVTLTATGDKYDEEEVVESGYRKLEVEDMW